MAKKKTDEKSTQDYALKDEIVSIVLMAVTIYLFLCNFGVGGRVGGALSGVMFGLFGLRAYVAPLLLAFGALFLISNKGAPQAIRKIVAGVALFFLIGVLIDLVMGRLGNGASIPDLYLDYRDTRGGAGVIAGFLGRLIYRYLSLTGTILLALVLAVICLVILTDRSFIRGVKRGSQSAIERAGEDYRQMRRRRAEERERELKRREEEEKEDVARREKLARELEREEDARILRMKKKKSGVTSDTDLRGEARRDEADLDDDAPQTTTDAPRQTETGEKSYGDEIHEITFTGAQGTDAFDGAHGVEDETETPAAKPRRRSAGLVRIDEKAPEDFAIPKTQRTETKSAETKAKKSAGAGRKYVFPSLKLLQSGDKKKNAANGAELKETAAKLEKILQTFNVNAKVVDVSRGPTVTRYELQPEIGVKVSRILNLADDIKLNLAATDIRIEAPIPGKVAVGIEVPNSENVTVTLRDLLEDKAYQDAASRLSFAVGKDIAGETIVTDIAKMPHLLIAGATGSGKSVCINTLILSLLYKASPDEVKLIMVDPKVVELNMYNGIPHLLIPVVTDPKKAAGALNWAVAEMEKRYRLFADAEVRDLAGYNKYVELHQGEEGFEKLPQIVLIVDELADLMMVSKSEVETAICRLAQLARAAGIHLIIATQRPSVDVITGLIKANMPSRIAFAVSSGVDSRTILDMNGAEKLLGKGDMLFFPQNYSKPVRVQGAFVSDAEIQSVCDFLKGQTTESYEAEQAAHDAQVSSMQSAQGAESATAQQGAQDRDAYFEEAGRFIIGKEKASIGNLQRVFKIGFNRAARIMDQLCEAGVVGEEEGTKPRRILMTMEEFDRLCETKESA